MPESSGTGMSGAWCEPRMHPATKWPIAKGARISPVAGKLIWVRTGMTGSSLPVYFPAMLCSREVATATACSPVARDQTDSTT